MKEGGEREDEGRVARQRAFLIGARGKLPPLIDREGQRLADSSRVLSLSLTHTLTLAFITRVAQARVQAACVSHSCTVSVFLHVLHSPLSIISLHHLLSPLSNELFVEER